MVSSTTLNRILVVWDRVLFFVPIILWCSVLAQDGVIMLTVPVFGVRHSDRSGTIWIHIIFPYTDLWATLMSTTKLAGRENLTKYAFWLGRGGPTVKENQVDLLTKKI